MQAVVTHDFNEATVEDVSMPTPADDEVLLEVKRVQLSVTECFSYTGQRSREKLMEIFETGPTRLFGHEFSAAVVEVGDDVTEFEVGDRVYAPGKIPCNACPYCEAGYEHFCQDKQYVGQDYPGGLAEYVSLPVEPLCTLPDGVSDAEGAALQPLASALLCVNDANIGIGDTVAVMGAGVMGYQAGQIARLLGAGPVVAIDIEPSKVELSEERGMVGVDARETDPEAFVDEITDGVGADIVIEAVGGDQNHVTEGSDPLAQAYRMVRTGGTILQIGIILGEMTIHPGDMRSKAVRWINPALGRMAFGPNAESGELAGELVASGRISIGDYITHELEGLDSFEEAVEITLNKEEYDARGPAQIVVSE